MLAAVGGGRPVAAPDPAALHRGWGQFVDHDNILDVAAPDRAALHRGGNRGSYDVSVFSSPPLTGRPFIEARRCGCAAGSTAAVAAPDRARPPAGAEIRARTACHGCRRRP